MKGRYLSIAFHATVFTVLLSAFAYVGLVWYLGTLPGDSGRAEHVTWTIEILDDASTSFYSSLNNDRNGFPIVAYYTSQDSALKFAEYVSSGGNCSNTSWNCEVVDDTAVVGQFSALSKSSSGNPIISYYDFTNIGLLKFAEYVGSQGNCTNPKWNCETITTTGTGGDYYTSLIVDITNQPIISYFDQNNTALKLARFVGPGGGDGTCSSQSWRCEVVDDSPTLGVYATSMLLDNTGIPIIAYNNDFSDGPKFARYVGNDGNCSGSNGRWSCEIVDNTTLVGYASPFVGFDSVALVFWNGTAAIAYYDVTNFDLKFAEFVGINGNCPGSRERWNCEVVDNTSEQVGLDVAMVISNQGNPIIAYRDKTNRRVKWAQYVGNGGNCTSTRWQCEIVDNNPVGGEDISLVITSAGNPLMSYSDNISTALKIAYIPPLPIVAAKQSIRRVLENSGPPQVVQGLDWTVEGDTVKLSWQDPPSFTLDHIEILRNYHPLPEVVTGDAYAVAEKGQGVFTDNKLVLGNTYRYIVRSVNGVGSYVNSEEITIEVKEEEVKEEEIVEEVREEEKEGEGEAVEAFPVEEEPQGTLVVSSVYKAVGIPDVYYIASNGKRYVFPGEDVYKSWYRDFDVVKEVDVREFVFYPLAGIVTYRPGLQLIKIATEPKVYVLEKGGVLRWIVNEGVASDLFGRTWDNRIVVVDAALFIHYRRGNNIASAADYRIPEGVNEAGCGEGETALTGTCALVEEGIPSEAPIVFVPTLEKEGVAPVSVIPTSSVFLWLARILALGLFLVIFCLRPFVKGIKRA